MQVIKGLSPNENRQRINLFINKLAADQDLSDKLYSKIKEIKIRR